MFVSGLNLSNIGINQPERLLEGGESLSILSRAYQSAQVRQSSALRSMQGKVQSLQEELDAFEKVSRTARLVRGGSASPPAELRSTAPLGLSTEDRVSTLSSADDINTDSTTVSPANPGWLGTAVSKHSTAAVTVSGTYLGGTTDTLTFEVTRSGRVGGAKAFGLDIYDSSGALIDSVGWGERDPPGTEATSTVTGLTLTLGSGRVRRRDTFEVAVASGLDLKPDATEILGTATSLGMHTTISSGSFTVNGTSISVDASTDSLQDVLDAISASGAGVTAALSDEQVTLTADSPGETITVGADSTGLLAALKLDSANATPGSVDDTTDPMAGVDAFSGVSAGHFTINGETISVDPAIDALADVLDAINAAGVGAQARLSGDTVQIVAEDGVSLTVGGDSSGFLSAIGIAEGTVAASEGSGGRRGSRQAARVLAKAFVDLAAAINTIFAEDADLGDSTTVDRIGMQSKIRASITTTLSERGMDPENNILKIAFNLSDDKSPALTMRRSDQKRLAKAMVDKPREVERLLFGSNQRPGLISAMHNAAEAAQEGLQDSLKEMGGGFSRYA